MASSRFIKDTGLTMRMTTVMFLLGALFVGLIAALIAIFGNSPGLIVLIGLAGIGVAWWQWYKSDSLAMRAMNAYEITPEEDPELYGMVQRLATLADMPMPRVGVSDLNMPNAFATGRSPDRSVVVVTRGIRGMLAPDELEAVLAHEMSHVAHRDVLVMTVASTAGIIAAMLTRGSQYGAMFGGNRRGNNNAGGLPIWLVVLVVSLVVYAVSFLLTRMLSRYRELCADRSAAYLTQKPSALASALQKITNGIAATPQRDLRASSAMNSFFIAPAVAGLSWQTLTSTHPSLEQRLDQLARIAAQLNRPLDGGPAAGA